MISDHHRLAAKKVTVSSAADRLVRCSFLFWLFFERGLLLSEAVLVLGRWIDCIIPLGSTRWSGGNLRMRIEKLSCARAVRLRAPAPSATAD